MKLQTKMPKYFQVKRQIEMLDALVARSAEIREFENLINSVMSGVEVKLFGHRRIDLLYRARFNEVGRLFGHVREMSYPIANADFSFPKGRFNDINQSTLYAARCELGTILELGPTVDRLFSIASIEPLTDNTLFVPVGIPDREFTMSPRNRAEELVREFFYRDVTKDVADSARSGYNCTIATGNHFMSNRVLSNGIMDVPSSRLGGVVYPSVRSRLLSNRTTYNYAVEPRFFDTHFKVKDVTVYCLTDAGESYLLSDVNKGVCRDDGAIEWQFDFEEMRARLRMGLTVSDRESKALSRSEKLHAGM